MNLFSSLSNSISMPKTIPTKTQAVLVAKQNFISTVRFQFVKEHLAAPTLRSRLMVLQQTTCINFPWFFGELLQNFTAFSSEVVRLTRTHPPKWAQSEGARDRLLLFVDVANTSPIVAR